MAEAASISYESEFSSGPRKSPPSSTTDSSKVRESLIGSSWFLVKRWESPFPHFVEQAFDIRRRVRAAVARGETQHGHTWLF